MPAEYEDAHLIAAATAITNLGNRIGLFYGNTRVGTVYTDTTWGTATAVTDNGERKGRRPGSNVTINVPASTVPNGTVIDKYGVFNGTTLLRKVPLTVSQVVNDGSQAFSIDVTPVYLYEGD
ncbi:hypothetical protein TIN4_26 [Tsukamurella phage TIN4]|uniref:Uncharacterized protein n=2 Tax=Tinduovirus TIN3 TaxID=1982571 RepID=A0A0K0N687_9CAUD|nr:hypothetical protein AVT54_gp099 [Tsukamurella phage TIN3]YP_009604156.1 hypothetical protein FDH87_gp099 [Tsukamurella phage TIN4]AKJ71823.1 hypothetical protein TIN3_26 [Tsukamurella phage TIN3]AKJ71932.1 hypothetical protein TIN4_26 [Tsukamurella phage TIN4]